MPEARDNKPKVKQLSIVIKNADGTEQIIKKYTPEELEALKSTGLNVATMAAKTITEAVKPVIDFLKEHADEIEQMKVKQEEFEELIPWIKHELDKKDKDPNYANVTFEDILSQYAEDGTPNEEQSAAAIIINRARRAKEQGAELNDIVYPDSLLYLTDKLTKAIFSNDNKIRDPYIGGTVNTNPSKKENRRAGAPDATITWYIDFIKLKDEGIIPQDFTVKDLNIMTAAWALCSENNNFCTEQQIYRLMHDNKTPNPRDIKDIHDRLTKMSACFYLSNAIEHKYYSKYDEINYDGPFLAFERVTGIVKGQITDNLIHFFRKPVLIEFAENRHQIETIPVKLIAEAPIAHTETNDQINNYLIGRVLFMKAHPEKPAVIEYDTLCERCKLSGKEKDRAEPKVKALLKHYQETGFILSSDIKMRTNKKRNQSIDKIIITTPL